MSTLALSHDAPTLDAVNAAIDYAHNHADEFLDAMIEWLKIPSISTRPEHANDVKLAANWLADDLSDGGLENAQILHTDGHPIVYADWLHAPGAPTVLFYGHYDVQPADNANGEWKTPPFEPSIRKENIYARGAADDKGQVVILAKAVQSYLQTGGSLPVNVKFFIEGEEETGSINATKFVPENRDLLAADIAFVSDTSFIDFNRPAIVYGLRGITAINININGPRLDLHSGSYGGAIDNPINVLAHIISKLKNENGRVLIPGFYDQVLDLSQQEIDLLMSGEIDRQRWLDWTGSPAMWGESEYSIVERLGSRPTLDVNGIYGGYTDEGAKTIIPSKAHAKITMRLVPHQNADDITEKFINYVRSIAPSTVEINFERHGTGPSSVSDINHPAMQAASDACLSVFDVEPVFKRSGGSIPVVSTLQNELGAEALMLGFGLPHDRLHAPNERFHLPNFYNGIETVIRFLANYGNQ